MSRPVTRRSKGSILKSQKSSETENAPETPGESNARRVSFAASNFVKPFSEDPEQVTAWDDTYEEEMRHTDSSKGTTASSLTLTVTEDTLEINLTKTTTQKITVPKILDKENLMPVEIPKKTRKSTNVKKNKDFDLKIFDSSDEDCSSFLSDKVELKKSNQVLVENKENIRIFEDSEELKDKNGKITIFDDSQVHMEMTANVPSSSILTVNKDDIKMTPCLPTLPILPVNDKDNNVKTLVFEDSQANMDFPSVESRRKTIVFNESQADLEMTGSLPTLPIPPVNNEDNKMKTKIFEDSQANMDFPSVESRRKTMVFNESQADIEMTACLPTLPIPPVNNEDIKIKTKIFEDSQANMDFTSVESNRRKTIVFNESQADLEMTGSLPTLPIPPVNNEYNKMKTKIFEDSQANVDFASVENRRKTMVFNESQADIEMTACLPTLPIPPVNNEDIKIKTKIFEDSQANMDFTSVESNRRKTIVFNESQADIEMTACLPTLPIPPVNNEGNKMKTKIFEDSQTNMDFTSVENNRRKTMVFNESQADLEMTGCLPTIPILPVNNEGHKMKTKIFEDSQANMDFTSVENNRRKTMVFNESQADIETTAFLSTLPILPVNNEGNKMKTKIFEDSQTSMVCTSVENNRRKTMVFNESQADIETTGCLPTLPILSVNNEGNKMKTKIFEDSQTSIDCTSVENNRRKTMVFNESQADIEMTACLPTLPILSVNNEGNKMKTKIFEDSQTSVVCTSVENNRRKTMVFNESQADLEMTGCLPTTPILPVKYEDIKMKTKIFEDSQANMDFTSVENRRKTMVFNESQTDISTTACLQTLPILRDNKTLTSYLEESQINTEENMSLSKNFPQRKERKKTMLFNASLSNTTPMEGQEFNDTSCMIVDMDIRTPLPEIEPNETEDIPKVRILQNITLENLVPVVDEKRKIIDVVEVNKNTESPISLELINDKQNTYVVNKKLDFSIFSESINDKQNTYVINKNTESSISNESIHDKQNTYVVNKKTDSLISNESFNEIPCFSPGNSKKLQDESFQFTDNCIDDTECLINADLSFPSKDQKVLTPEAVKKSSCEEEILTYKPIDMRLYKAKLLEKLRPSLEELQKVYDDMKNIRFEEPSVDIDSSSESEEEPILEDKPKTILEKIQEADERSGLFWTFDHHEASTYFFTTFNRNARFSVDIDSQDYVTNVTTSLHVPEGSYAVAKLQLNFFVDKMKKEKIESALGTKYDILGLLDYVYMHVKEIHLAGFRLLTGIQKKHRLRVNDDMVVYFRVLSIELIIAWEFEVDMLNIHEPKIVTARSLFGTPLNEEKIRELAMYCPTGLHFIEKYIEKILEYCETDIRPQLIQSGDI